MDMEKMGVITWFFVSHLIYVGPLCRQYTITPDPQSAVILDIRANLVIFEPLNHIQLRRPIYEVTSYVDFSPYLNPFNMFETYWVNFTNDLNSPDVLAHFQEADTTFLFGEDMMYSDF